MWAGAGTVPASVVGVASVFVARAGGVGVWAVPSGLGGVGSEGGGSLVAGWNVVVSVAREAVRSRRSSTRAVSGS